MKPIFRKHIDKKIEKIIRVNLSGERSAKKIYSEQIKLLILNQSSIEEIENLTLILNQEIKHLEYFEKFKVPFSLLTPIWDAFSSKIGKIIENRFIFRSPEQGVELSTLGVEEVILEHYRKQLIDLENIYNLGHKTNEIQDLILNISQFLKDEESHISKTSSNIDMNFIQKAVVRSINLSCVIAIFLTEKTFI